MLIRCMRQYIMNMEELSAVMSAVCNKAHRRQQPEKRSKYRSLGSPVYNSCSWMIQTEFVCPEEYLHFQISHSRMRHCQRRSSTFDSWMADYFVPIPMHYEFAKHKPFLCGHIVDVLAPQENGNGEQTNLCLCCQNRRFQFEATRCPPTNFFLNSNSPHRAEIEYISKCFITLVIVVDNFFIVVTKLLWKFRLQRDHLVSLQIESNAQFFALFRSNFRLIEMKNVFVNVEERMARFAILRL